jgi:hypothetical protein
LSHLLLCWVRSYLRFPCLSVLFDSWSIDIIPKYLNVFGNFFSNFCYGTFMPVLWFPYDQICTKYLKSSWSMLWYSSLSRSFTCGCCAYEILMSNCSLVLWILKCLNVESNPWTILAGNLLISWFLGLSFVLHATSNRPWFWFSVFVVRIEKFCLKSRKVEKLHIWRE